MPKHLGSINILLQKNDTKKGPRGLKAIKVLNKVLILGRKEIKVYVQNLPRLKIQV